MNDRVVNIKVDEVTRRYPSQDRFCGALVLFTDWTFQSGRKRKYGHTLDLPQFETSLDAVEHLMDLIRTTAENRRFSLDGVMLPIVKGNIREHLRPWFSHWQYGPSWPGMGEVVCTEEDLDEAAAMAEILF